MLGNLVHISAIGADAGSDSLYAQSKAAGEAAVLAAFPAAMILRPSVIFGPEDQFFNRFAGMARLGPDLASCWRQRPSFSRSMSMMWRKRRWPGVLGQASGSL